MLQPGETLTPMARQNVQARLRAERMWTWTNCAARALPADAQHEREGGRLHDHRRRPGGRAGADRQPAEDGGELPARLPARDRRSWEGIRADAGEAGVGGARRRHGGREGPDAVPRARRLLRALRRREDVARRGRRGAARDVPRARARRSSTRGRAKFARLFTASIYKWVQAPLSLHVGNLDLDRERALQLPVVQRSEWQKR